MALQTFGTFAGVAAAVQSTVMTFGSLIVAALIGNLYDQTLVPVLGGYLIFGLAAIGLLRLR